MSPSIRSTYMRFIPTLMEDSSTRKRFVQPPPNVKFPYYIHEQVYFLSKMRHQIPKIADPISLALRVAILLDLIEIDAIKIENDIVYCCGTVQNNSVLEETLSLIRNNTLHLKELLVSLNGESFLKNRNMHVKRVRERIGKRLEDKGILSYDYRGKFFKGKVRLNLSARKEMLDDVFSLFEGEYDVRKLAVVGCLMYCDALTSLYISQPLNRVLQMEEKSIGIKKKFMVQYVGDNPKERGMFFVIRQLHRM